MQYFSGYFRKKQKCQLCVVTVGKVLAATDFGHLLTQTSFWGPMNGSIKFYSSPSDCFKIYSVYSKYFSLEQSVKQTDQQTTGLAKKINKLKKNCLALAVELAHLYQSLLRQNSVSQYSQASSNILFLQFQSPCEQRLQLTVC